MFTCSNSLKGVHKLLLIVVQFPLRLHNILKCTCMDALQTIVVVTYDAGYNKGPGDAVNYIHGKLPLEFSLKT